MKNRQLIVNPPRSLVSAVIKRQGLRPDWVERTLKSADGYRIYCWPGKRGPEIALRGWVGI
jgi:hypothetical protein